MQKVLKRLKFYGNNGYGNTFDTRQAERSVAALPPGTDRGSSPRLHLQQAHPPEASRSSACSSALSSTDPDPPTHTT